MPAKKSAKYSLKAPPVSPRDASDSQNAQYRRCAEALVKSATRITSRGRPEVVNSDALFMFLYLKHDWRYVRLNVDTRTFSPLDCSALKVAVAVTTTQPTETLTMIARSAVCNRERVEELRDRRKTLQRQVVEAGIDRMQSALGKLSALWKHRDDREVLDACQSAMWLLRDRVKQDILEIDQQARRAGRPIGNGKQIKADHVRTLCILGLHAAANDDQGISEFIESHYPAYFDSLKQKNANDVDIARGALRKHIADVRRKHVGSRRHPLLPALQVLLTASCENDHHERVTAAIQRCSRKAIATQGRRPSRSELRPTTAGL